MRNARGTRSSSSTRIGDQMSFGLLKCDDNDIPGDGGEVIRKFLQRVAALDVIDERLHGTRAPTNTGVPPRMSGSE